MGPSWWQLLVVLVLVVLLFGRGKISDLMGDVAKGIKSFKDGMADDGELQGVIEHEGSKVPAERPQPLKWRTFDNRPADTGSLQAFVTADIWRHEAQSFFRVTLA